ncbi:uncharacterized protein OCT59_007730 [Rhizophagus irregularis]|uniref:uncharacterized protein n=1 Tax=Rhizophagus irregularis TaxID=588596 RepID=UPI0033267CB9|nr:hypothetical protein OCT59_007730 [Rhizophagus irregularis]
MYFKDQQTTERAVEESIKQVSDGGDAAPLTSKVELAEDTVVNVINKHRMGLKKKLRKLVAVTSKKLQKDNVTTDEVIDNFHENPIKPYKRENKILSVYQVFNSISKIRLDSGGKRIKKKPPKHCQNCKETNDCVKLFLNKINRLEEIVDNFRKNLPKKTNKISIFCAKFTLNSVHCELEYDLSCFTLENLLILQLKIATQQ